MNLSTWRSSTLPVTLGFALSGMLTGGLMQTDVTVYERVFGLTHERVSFWLSIFSVLTAVGGAVAGVLSDRWGAARVYRACVFLSGVGMAGFAWSFLPSTVLGFIAAGFGVGGLIVGNILVSHDESKPPNRSLNHLHTSHGLARLAGVFLSIFALGLAWQASYLIVGIAFVLLAALYAPIAPARPAADSAGTPARPDSAMPLPLFWICAAFLLYMTAEMVLVTWLAAYFEQDRHMDPGVSRAIYGVFLAGLISGRMMCARVCPVELTTRTCRNLALVHLAAMTLFLASPHPLASAVALFAAGWCEGPGWPSLFSYAMRRAGGQEGKVTSVLYVVCCIGIVVATYGSGLLAQRAGLASTFYVVGAAHLAFSVVFYKLIRAEP